MCGIAGIYNFDQSPVEQALVRKMTDAMRHRGPDDAGFHVDSHVGLGHRRLSIIDLSAKGHQPMTNEDGSVWLTFNGEIYNYLSLYGSLRDKGHQFRSRCDTETIIHHYEEKGKDCLEDLRGMFSFAIWDKKRRYLFAAVDRMRIKPFYYTRVGDTFLFASELKGLFATGLVPKKLNHEAVHHYLSLQAVPVPMTIFENVYTLPGGYALEIENGKMRVFQYWDMQYAENDPEQSEEFYRKRVRELTWESIEMRMMSDVPLGAFLSGGIDSSTIVAVMSQVSEKPIKTYSIGYDVGGSAYDDTYYANLVSKRFKTEHTQRTVTARDVIDKLPGFLHHLDQPSSDAINSYFVSELAARDLTVVLSGQGGDELFAGYNSFKLLEKFVQRDEKWEKLPPLLRKAVAGAVQKAGRFLDEHGSFIKKYARIRMEMYEEEKRAFYSKAFSDQLNGADTFKVYEDHLVRAGQPAEYLNKVSYLDLKTHLGDILMRDVDAMSMAFSLETRVPLIDHKLVEFANTVPPHLKLHNGTTKYILIESVRDLLPDEVINRPKLGFNFPFAVWLRRELFPLVDYVLSREVVEARGIFNYAEMARLKHEFLNSDMTYRRVWGIVLLELWLRHVFDEDHGFVEKVQDLALAKQAA